MTVGAGVGEVEKVTLLRSPALRVSQHAPLSAGFDYLHEVSIPELRYSLWNLAHNTVP
jgi:hypothetical protein